MSLIDVLLLLLSNTLQFLGFVAIIIAIFFGMLYSAATLLTAEEGPQWRRVVMLCLSIMALVTLITVLEAAK